MPTPVATARQCLTEEAARALDDAVSVAKRRSHAQTTSLHAISALLTPSFSLLRDALSRARSSAYSPRLQLRALELCVGVSLDRLPSSKQHDNNNNQNDEFAPPISNSLMAAIKRSQANQRRQPDMYHLSQIHVVTPTNNNNVNNGATATSPLSISSIKVELKHFILSILDDPIVSRVFGEAGFRSSDIKMAILHPPRWAPSTTSSRCPPLFLCNFMDFTAAATTTTNFDDGNSKRICEVMVKKKGGGRNPVLVGVCAKDALAGFKECILKNKLGGVHEGLDKVKLVCLESVIKGKDNEGLDFKVKEVRSTVEIDDCASPGVVINLGELQNLISINNDNGEGEGEGEGDDDNYGEGVVERVSKLIEEYGKRIWVIGGVANYETYSKFVGKYAKVEKEWDLHPLPITSSSSSSSSTGSGSGSGSSFEPKSSLMGSFVPFGGFFPTPSEFRTPLIGVKQAFARCDACNENYERELCAMLREGSSIPTSDEQSSSLPSWLRSPESGISKAGNVATQIKDVRNEKTSCLQKKWDDHCRLVHQSSSVAAPAVPLASLQIPQPLGLQIMAPDILVSRCSSRNSSLYEKACSNVSSGMQFVAQSISPHQQVMNTDFPKRSFQISETHPSARSSAPLTYSSPYLGPPLHQKPQDLVSVTTDLGLGTIYASKCEEIKKPFFQDRLQQFPGSFPAHQGILGKKDSTQVVQSSFPHGPCSVEGLDPGAYKSLFRKLSEAAPWQGEAISKIAEIMSCYRSGNGCQQTANNKGNVWLSFLGPDKLGKKKIAQALADAVFGSRDRLIALDLSSQDMTTDSNSLFHCHGSNGFDINSSRVTLVDHIAQELSKKPQSVVFLENIQEADPLVQSSLSHAIQTGKFRVPGGREVGINNIIFVTTSTVTKDETNLSPRKEFIKFTEERILEAKNWQMQLGLRSVSDDSCSRTESKVSLLPPKHASNHGSSYKRKLSKSISDTSEHLSKRANKIPESALDLNLPLGDEEEAVETDSYNSDNISDGSRSWLEDFFSQVNGDVAFRPFNFDALADSLLRKICLKLKESFRQERILLEIDYDVMVQILGAAWFSDKKKAAEDWIEDVLGTSIAEARERFCLTAKSVIRLGSCEGVPAEECASGIRLPNKIKLSI